jgi:hypothetical protein
VASANTKQNTINFVPLFSVASVQARQDTEAEKKKKKNVDYMSLCVYSLSRVASGDGAERETIKQGINKNKKAA